MNITVKWYINHANKLAKAIDESETKPIALMLEWEQCVSRIMRLNPFIQLDETVICPQNW